MSSQTIIDLAQISHASLGIKLPLYIASIVPLGTNLLKFVNEKKLAPKFMHILKS